jgi:dipeptidyl aminopeptidase/acylaminoacyl peptidase
MLAFSASAQQQQLAPLPVQEALAARTFSTTPFSLSSDSQWIAYTLTDPKRSQLIPDERQKWLTPSGTPPGQIGSDVWITNTRTRETRNLTEGKGNSWAASWSPDSSHLAFFSDRGGRAGLWIWEKSSGKLRQVSDLTVIGYRGLSVPRWTYDSKSILFCVLPEEMTIEKAALLTIGFTESRPVVNRDKQDQPTVTVFKSAAAGRGAPDASKNKSLSTTYNEGYAADLVVADISGGRVKRLTKGYKPCAYWLSPDGTYVAFTNIKTDANRTRFDLVAVSLRDGTANTLATNLQQAFVGLSVSWSSTGILSYTTSESQPGGSLRRECYLISGDGKQKRKVTGAPPAGFSNPLRAPLWDKAEQSLYLTSGSSLWRVTETSATAQEVARLRNRTIVDIVPSATPGQFWSPDNGRSLLVITSDPESLRTGFSRIDLASGEVTTLLEEDKVYGAGNPLLPAAIGSPDGRSLLYIAEDAGHNPDFWAFDEQLRNPRRVTATNPAFDKYVMGASHLIEWRGPLGERLRGALLLPAGYQQGKNYPMVVLLYPNDELSQQLNLFGLTFNVSVDAVNNKQLLATRGYAVLLADSRMTVGTPMQELVRTVLPGVNKVIEMGIADPERLGIIGHSHGGYAVLSVITQVQRFKAAVSWAGSANLVTMYGQMDSDGRSHWIDWNETGAGSMGGNLWEMRERYIENSPIFYLDRVNTPLLIVQGTSDRVTTPNHSEEIFVGLRRLGKEVQYARYEGEDHAFWFYPNRVDLCNRMIGWFDQWLKTAPTDLSKTP